MRRRPMAAGVDEPATAGPAVPSLGEARAGRAPRRRLRPPSRSTVLVALAVAGALAAAGLSLLWQRLPQFDPQGWLLWGREVTGSLVFDTRTYPSWKPLGLVISAPVALTGSAAPALMLVVARAGALLGLLAAFRLAARFGGVLAGAIAVVAIVLLPGWLGLSADGHLEPLLLALLLAAAELHLSGRRGWALVVGGLTGLARVEVWPAIAVYAVLICWEDRRRIPLAVVVLLALPAVWFGGDWAGSGHPLHAGHLARHAGNTIPQDRSGHPVRYVAGVARRLITLPLWIGVAVALAVALRRRRLLVPGLVAIGVSWLVVDVVMAAYGYPGDPRFMLPAGGLLAVAAAIGGARLVRTIPRRWLQVAAVAAIAAALYPGFAPRARALPRQARSVVRYGGLVAALDRAVADLGGRPVLARCRHVYTDQYLSTRLAWELDRTGSVARRSWRPSIVLDLRRSRLRALLASRAHRHRLRLRALGLVGRFRLLALVPRRGGSPRGLGAGCLAGLLAHGGGAR